MWWIRAKDCLRAENSKNWMNIEHRLRRVGRRNTFFMFCEGKVMFRKIWGRCFWRKETASHQETRSTKMLEYTAQANEFARVEVASFRGLETTPAVCVVFLPNALLNTLLRPKAWFQAADYGWTFWCLVLCMHKSTTPATKRAPENHKQSVYDWACAVIRHV